MKLKIPQSGGWGGRFLRRPPFVGASDVVLALVFLIEQVRLTSTVPGLKPGIDKRPQQQHTSDYEERRSDIHRPIAISQCDGGNTVDRKSINEEAQNHPAVPNCQVILGSHVVNLSFGGSSFSRSQKTGRLTLSFYNSIKSIICQY